jgi:hypothetical protein
MAGRLGGRTSLDGRLLDLGALGTAGDQGLGPSKSPVRRIPLLE